MTKKSDISQILKADEDARQRRVARDAVHSLKGKKAAPRILMGAFLSGDIDKEKTSRTFELMRGNRESLDELVPVKAHDNTLQRAVSKTGMKILFVDDKYDSDGWKVLLDSVLGEGNTLYALSKDEALKSIDSDGSVGVVLLDLRLPSKPEEGIEALVEIKNARPDIPVVIFTGEESAKYQRKCYAKGCFDYFVKEFQEEEKNYEGYYKTFREIIESSLTYSQSATLWRQAILFGKQVGTSDFKELFHHLRKACYFLTDGENDWKAHAMLSEYGITHYGEVIIQCSNAIEAFVEKLTGSRSRLMRAGKLPKDNMEQILSLALISEKKQELVDLPYNKKIELISNFGLIDSKVYVFFRDVRARRNNCAHSEKSGLHVQVEEARDILSETMAAFRNVIPAWLKAT